MTRKNTNKGLTAYNPNMQGKCFQQEYGRKVFSKNLYEIDECASKERIQQMIERTIQNLNLNEN